VRLLGLNGIEDFGERGGLEGSFLKEMEKFLRKAEGTKLKVR